MRHFMLLSLSLLILSIAPNAQPQSGRVPFDYPNEPFVEFRFDLDRSMIALVMEDAELRYCIAISTRWIAYTSVPTRLVILTRCLTITERT